MTNRRRFLLAMSLALAWTANAFAAGAARTMDPVDPPRAVADFTLPGIDGREHSLADYRGRYVLVNFWAVWCTPCRREMPALRRANDALKNDGVAMLGIHVGPSLARARDYAEPLALGFPILVDTDLGLADWGVRGLPTTFLLDPQGRIVAEAVGEREWDSPTMLDWFRARTKP